MWEQHGAHRHIHRVRLKLYVLLAGVMKWTWKSGPPDSEEWEQRPMETNTSEGLDWKRSLALHLSFGSDLSSHLTDAMERYTHAFQEEDPPYAPPPCPPHMERLSPSPNMSSTSFDTCYHLLRLYSQRNYPMEHILQPTASSPSSLDYRVW